MKYALHSETGYPCVSLWKRKETQFRLRSHVNEKLYKQLYYFDFQKKLECCSQIASSIFLYPAMRISHQKLYFNGGSLLQENVDINIRKNQH